MTVCLQIHFYLPLHPMLVAQMSKPRPSRPTLEVNDFELNTLRCCFRCCLSPKSRCITFNHLCRRIIVRFSIFDEFLINFYITLLNKINNFSTSIIYVLDFICTKGCHNVNHSTFIVFTSMLDVNYSCISILK